MADYPDDRSYSEDHEWVRPAGEVQRVGITDYAAEQLGDIVYVSLPEVGQEVARGEACGELESTKSVSDVYSPVSGVVKAVNPAVSDDPAAVNADPYGDGWLFEIEPSDASELDALLDAAGYADHVG